MEQQFNQEEGKEDLPNPQDGDSGWDDIVKKDIIPKPPITCKRGRHMFMQTGSREARCVSCPLGYVLSPGMIVMDGHIYKENNVVI